MPILIIEDEPQLQFVLRQILSLKGHQSVVAGTAGEALAQLRSNAKFSLILLDVGLPDMGCDRLLSEITALTKNTIPVLAVSGSPDLFDMKFPPCVVGAVAKPFDFAELLGTVERFTGRSHAEASATP
jgi:DNA-binding response OmpR family regulator